MRMALERHVAHGELEERRDQVANNLSELLLMLGDVAEAVAMGKASVAHADRSGDAFHRMDTRTAFGRCSAPSGLRRHARKRFSRRPRRSRRPSSRAQYPRLYSLPGLPLQRSAAHPRSRRRGARAGRTDATVGAAGTAGTCSTPAWITFRLAGRRWRWASMVRPRVHLNQAVDGLRQAG